MFKRIFFSISSLWSLIITMIYAFAQYYRYIHNQDTMKQDDIVFAITVSLLIYILTTTILTLLSETDKLLNPKEGTIDNWQRNISIIIDKRFAETINKFANTHEGFIHGMYNNYPHNFTSIFDKKDETFKELNERGIKSLYLWRNNIGIDSYLELANELLKLTKDSVYATTYYDNDQFINVIENNSKVKTWLDSVNEKNQIKRANKIKLNPNFTLFRVHMFKNNTLNKTTSKDFNDFLESISKNKQALNYYINKFVKPCDYFHTWYSEGEIRFYGEYIIFDEQIMIKYDEDFGVLELYIGNIVEEHARNFRCEAIHFELDKEKMLKLLSIS